MSTEPVKPRNSLFGPVLLIGLGILFLLSNLGVLNLDFWTILFRFWPVLLIAIGLDILLGRRSGVGALLAIVLLGVVIVGSLGWWEGGWAPARSGETRSISQGLEGAERAEITLAAGVSQLMVSATPATNQLIEGTIVPLRTERIAEDFQKDGAVGKYTLNSEGRFTFPGWGWGNRGQWELRLTQAVPLDLAISTGVGKATLNLERLQLTRLEVNTGVGETTITLPGRGDFRAEIDGGVGQVTILIPDSLGVRMEANAGIGSVDVEGDFTQDEKVYTSANYDRAENRAEVNVSGGVGSITIRQIARE
jgi:hypothetical protein